MIQTLEIKKDWIPDWTWNLYFYFNISHHSGITQWCPTFPALQGRRKWIPWEQQVLTHTTPFTWVAGTCTYMWSSISAQMKLHACAWVPAAWQKELFACTCLPLAWPVSKKAKAQELGTPSIAYWKQTQERAFKELFLNSSRVGISSQPIREQFLTKTRNSRLS